MIPSRLIRNLLAWLILLIPTSATAQLMTSSSAMASQSPQVILDRVPGFIQIGASSSVSFGVANSTSTTGLSALFLIYPKITSRSGFNEIKSHGSVGYPLVISPSTPLTQLGVSGGVFRLPVAIDGSSGPTNTPVLPGCATGCSGIYPLAIRIVDSSSGQVVSQTTIPIMVVQALSVPHPLTVVPVIEVTPETPPSVLAGLINFLSSNSTLSASIAPYGQALASVDANRKYSSSLIRLSSWSRQSSHQVITTAFSSAAPDCTLQGQVPGSFNDQLSTTRQLLAQSGIAQSGLTYLFSRSPSRQGLASVATLGFEATILPPTSYPSGLPLSLVSPLYNRAAAITELVADPGLQNDLTQTSNTSVASEIASADLGQIYFDAPNSTTPRIVTSLLKVSDRSSLKTVTSFLARILASPLVQTQSAQGALSNFSASGAQRVNATGITHRTDCSIGTPTRRASALISGFVSAKPPASVTQKLNELLLSAEGIDISPQQRSTLLQGIGGIITKQLSGVTIVQGGVLTLTAKRANIPISLISKLSYPLDLSVHVRSDKLTLPQGSSKTTRVSQSSVTVSFVASTKALGSFPLDVTLTTPSGLVLKTAVLEVRSTSFSLVGIILTGGSLLVLIVWWIRSPRKRRMLAMAEEQAPASEELAEDV